MAEGVDEARGKCRIRWYENGKRRSEVLEFPYTKAGIKRAAAVRQQYIKAAERGETALRETPTFGELAQTRLNTAQLTPETRRTQKIYLNKYWMDWAGDVPIDEIRYDDIIGLKSLDLAPKTIKHILSAGSAVFDLALRSRYITENPALLVSRDLKVPKKKVDPFTREERDQILDSLQEPHQHLFYAIRFYCGLRPSEAIALRWRDYDGQTLQVSKGRVRGDERAATKNGQDREVPVHPYVQKLLRATPRRFDNDHIVINQHGRHYNSAHHLAQAFARTLDRLGIRYRSPYNVRHTCATMMLEAGMKPGYCAKVLGHSLEMFFNIYADWIDKDESKVQEGIWATI